MRILAKSDIGKLRDMNQDSYYVSDLEKDDIKLFILADGMGGYKGGEIASSLAIASARNFIINNFKNTKKDRENIIKNTKEVLLKAIEKGGTTIRSYTSAEGVHGLFQHELYVHGKDVCPICNHNIEKIRVGGRGTYYCPRCQK